MLFLSVFQDLNGWQGLSATDRRQVGQNGFFRVLRRRRFPSFQEPRRPFFATVYFGQDF
jgi:hypothetical protein